MGDARFQAAYAKLRDSPDRAMALATMSDEDVVEALAAASRANDPLVANVLATEATNRMRRLRASLAELGEGVVTLGQDGRVRWCNAAAERLLGLKREEMMGRAFGALVEAGSAAAMESILAGGRSAGEVAGLARCDGAQVDVVYTVSPIHGPQGESAGTVISLADCTQRRKHERALRVSEQTFRSLFEHFPDAIVRVNVDGTVLDVNGAAERLLGLPATATRGRPFVDFVDPVDIERSSSLFTRVAQGAVARATVRLVQANGAQVDVDAVGIPVIVDGEVVGVHGIARERSRSSPSSAQTS